VTWPRRVALMAAVAAVSYAAGYGVRYAKENAWGRLPYPLPSYTEPTFIERNT
jgi:hypothetical protein